MSLRQIDRSPAQDLVLLRRQLDPPTRFPQFRALLAGHPRPGPVLDVRPTHPLPQRHRVRSEAGGHLPDRHTRAAVSRDSHDVLSELFRIGLWQSDILPTRPTGQASSDVTRSGSRPPRQSMSLGPPQSSQWRGHCWSPRLVSRAQQNLVDGKVTWAPQGERNHFCDLFGFDGRRVLDRVLRGDHSLG